MVVNTDDQKFPPTNPYNFDRDLHSLCYFINKSKITEAEETFNICEHHLNKQKAGINNTKEKKPNFIINDNHVRIMYEIIKKRYENSPHHTINEDDFLKSIIELFANNELFVNCFSNDGEGNGSLLFGIFNECVKENNHELIDFIFRSGAAKHLNGDLFGEFIDISFEEKKSDILMVLLEHGDISSLEEIFIDDLVTDIKDSFSQETSEEILKALSPSESTKKDLNSQEQFEHVFDLLNIAIAENQDGLDKTELQSFKALNKGENPTFEVNQRHVDIITNAVSNEYDKISNPPSSYNRELLQSIVELIFSVKPYISDSTTEKIFQEAVFKKLSNNKKNFLLKNVDALSEGSAQFLGGLKLQKQKIILWSGAKKESIETAKNEKAQLELQQEEEQIGKWISELFHYIKNKNLYEGRENKTLEKAITDLDSGVFDLGNIVECTKGILKNFLNINVKTFEGAYTQHTATALYLLVDYNQIKANGQKEAEPIIPIKAYECLKKQLLLVAKITYNLNENKYGVSINENILKILEDQKYCILPLVSTAENNKSSHVMYALLKKDEEGRLQLIIKQSYAGHPIVYRYVKENDLNKLIPYITQKGKKFQEATKVGGSKQDNHINHIGSFLYDIDGSKKSILDVLEGDPKTEYVKEGKGQKKGNCHAYGLLSIIIFAFKNGYMYGIESENDKPKQPKKWGIGIVRNFKEAVKNTKKRLPKNPLEKLEQILGIKLSDPLYNLI